MKVSLKAYYYSAIILTLLSSVTYAISFIFAFDTPIAYFSEQSFLPYIAKYLLLFTCIWILSIFVFIPKNTLTTIPSPTSLISKIASWITMLGFLVGAVIKFTSSPFSGLSIAVIIFSILSVLFFLLNALYSDSHNNLRALAGIFVILWAAGCMTEAYINWNITMNNPVKILLMLSMMSTMFFVLYEIKYLVGSPAPRACVAAHLINMCISVSFLISFIIIYTSQIYVIREFLPTVIALFPITIYQICRSIDFISNQNQAIAS